MIYVIFSKNRMITGQEMASRVMVDVLRERAWDFKIIESPSFDRDSGNTFLSKLVFIYYLFNFWIHICFLACCSSGNPIYVNLGQSIVSFIREGIVPVLFRFFSNHSEIVISLHGHFFMHWPCSSLKARMFLAILRRATIVTVLGENQKSRLIELGITANKLVIVNNTCKLKPVQEQEISRKMETGTFKLLFLSNLVASKGYIETLDALDQLCDAEKLPREIEFVLCGTLLSTGFDADDCSLPHGRQEIISRIDKLNRNQGIKACWLEGAYGIAKERLFHNANLFIFPSRTEAQPIVLIEAMASGCGIITSDAGEIRGLVGNDNAIILSNPSAENIANAIKKLIYSPEQLLAMSKASLMRYHQYFSPDKYADSWEAIFKRLNNE